LRYSGPVELDGLAAELGVRELADPRLEVRDADHPRLDPFDFALVAGTEELLDDAADHGRWWNVVPPSARVDPTSLQPKTRKNATSPGGTS
jgi:hypothetical protein